MNWSRFASDIAKSFVTSLKSDEGRGEAERVGKVLGSGEVRGVEEMEEVEKRKEEEEGGGVPVGFERCFLGNKRSRTAALGEPP
jgi:hypothetical protein